MSRAHARRPGHKLRGFGRFRIGLALAAVTVSANAWQINYALEMALGHSDNINQSSIDPTGQTLLIPRLDFDLSEDGADLKARAYGQVEYRDYLQGAFGNEFRGQFTGVATWMILPQRLSFDFEDYAAVQPVNILEPNAPNNQQQTNIFTLGPTFNFRLRPTLEGEADLRLTDSNASQTKEFNSDRTLAALRVLDRLDPLDTLSANLEGQNVHFTDRSGGPDYDRYDAFLRYQSKLADIDLDLAGGYAHLDFSGAEGSRDGPTAHASAAWRVTPENTLSLAAARQYSDASQDMVVDPTALVAITPGTGVVVGTATVTSQVFLEYRADASYVFQTARFGLRLAPYYRRLDYLIDTTLDETGHGLNAGFSYRPRPLWTLALDASEETRNYTFLQRRDEDVRVDLSFTDQLSRHFSMRFDLIRNERHSDVANQGFRENVVFATVIFRR
ncbi:MAG TPA: hypothetical protein VGH81_05135 [Rudaea sp.]|jgi:hypothetical protein